MGRYSRSVGKVWLDTRHINREMVRQGHARVCREYMGDKSLLDDEDQTRRAKLGFWSLPDAVSPWE